PLRPRNPAVVFLRENAQCDLLTAGRLPPEKGSARGGCRIEHPPRSNRGYGLLAGKLGSTPAATQNQCECEDLFQWDPKTRWFPFRCLRQVRVNMQPRRVTTPIAFGVDNGAIISVSASKLNARL